MRKNCSGQHTSVSSAILLLTGLSLLGCKSDFEEGMEALKTGNRRVALDHFGNVSTDDENYQTALTLFSRIKDTLAVESGDSSYDAGNYSQAVKYYATISKRDTAIEIRVGVCRGMSEFERLADPAEKYQWLSERFLQYSNGLLNVRHRRSQMANDFLPLYLSTDKRRIGAFLAYPWWTANWGLFYLHLLLGEKEYLSGIYAEATCSAWGDQHFLSWQTDGGSTDDNHVYLNRFIINGDPYEAYFFSDVPIPGRTRHNLLVKPSGPESVRMKSGELREVNRFEIIAALSYDWTTPLTGYNIGFGKVKSGNYVLTCSKNLNQYLEEIPSAFDQARQHKVVNRAPQKTAHLKRGPIYSPEVLKHLGDYDRFKKNQENSGK